MDRKRALRTLGLENADPGKDVTADQIARAYRKLIRQAHPDAGGNTAVAARITEAYAWLQRAGPAPPPKDRPRAYTSKTYIPDDGSLVLLLPPGDVFTRLSDAAQKLGELSYADADSGILQVTFTAPGRVVCQLVATILPGTSKNDTRVEFTLAPLTSGEAPPIASVVTYLTSLFSDDLPD